jgi:small subunit ribosomal protein S16
MLTIRLNRVGKNKRAAFRLAVQEHTVAPGGRHVELVGSYDPHTKKATLNVDRIKYWISVGAQPSDSAFNLLVREKAIDGAKKVKKIPKPVVAEAPVEEVKTEEVKAEAPAEVAVEAPVEAAPVVEEKKVEAPVEVAPEAPKAEEVKPVA